MHLDTVLPV